MQPLSRVALVRIAFIDRELRKGNWPNASSLARQLEVNPRTIHRDLDCLRDQLLAPLEFDRDRNGYRYTDPAFRLPMPVITEGEYVALFLAGRLLRQYRGTPFYHELVRLFERIAALLPETIAVDLDHLSQTCDVRLPPTFADDADHFRAIHKAVQERQRLELVYWSASRDQTSRRLVDPYAITFADDCYLVGYCHERKQILIFAVSRIREIENTGVTFDIPANFCLADYLDDGLRKFRGAGPRQTYRLRFSPQIARYVREKTYHRSQQFTDLPGGGLIMTLKVNHSLEVKRLALSFGQDCEVLEPEALRSEMAEELAQALAQYRAPHSAARKLRPRLRYKNPKERSA